MPFLQSAEEPYGVVHLLIGVGVLVLGLVAIIVYLHWKLPRDGPPNGGGGPAKDS